MRKLIKLEKDNNVLFASNISEYLNPDYIYLPIKKNYKLLVKSNEYVYKGQVIMENNLNKVICSVSGIVLGLSNKMIDNETCKCVVIQNDYKEKEKIKRPRTPKYTKDFIISKLYEFYFKYIASSLETKNIKNLVISGIDDEPYILNNTFILNKYIKEILEMSDILSTTFAINNTVIVMKSMETKLIEKYLGKIGTYPNLHLKFIDDKYLLGNAFFLTEYLDYKDLDTLVIDVKTILNMYNAIKFGKNTTETFITVSGLSLAKSYVMKVKIGTLLQDIFNENIKVKIKNSIFVQNGLMTGRECNLSDTVVTNNTIGVVVMPKVEVKEKKCNSCGLCYKYCPVKVNPKNVMDSKKVSKNCIDCGICSYVCPCHINLRKYLWGEHE